MSGQHVPLLEVSDLKKEFHIGGGFLGAPAQVVQAVSGISFQLEKGETFGLVGESGCGKTTLGRCILRLVEATSGKVSLEGRDIFAVDASTMRTIRSDLQIVFQDPMASLHPRMTIRQILADGMRLAKLPKSQVNNRIVELLELVKLPADVIERYPHELSGGQRQRIGIARAVSLNPKVIVLDEPVSALDVSIQAGILNLLMELQEKLGISYVFIAHDLGVVRHISHRVGVMYMGLLIEVAPVEALFTAPQHPYTLALMSAIPNPDPRAEAARSRIVLRGELPNPLDPPSGCRFRTRCPKAAAVCAEELPPLSERAANHFVACHFPEDTQPILDAIQSNVTKKAVAHDTQ